MSPTPTINFDDYLRVDIRIGTIVDTAAFPEAQITDHYAPETLIGRQVMAVVNFPPRQIGPMMSEVLTLGFADANGGIVLTSPDPAVPNGQRLL